MIPVIKNLDSDTQNQIFESIKASSNEISCHTIDNGIEIRYGWEKMNEYNLFASHKPFDKINKYSLHITFYEVPVVGRIGLNNQGAFARKVFNFLHGKYQKTHS